jgi:hypothetical protein
VNVAGTRLKLNDRHGIALVAPDFRLVEVADKAAPAMFDHLGKRVHGVGLEDAFGNRQRSVETGFDQTQAEGIIGISEPLGNFCNWPAELVPEIRVLATGVRGIVWPEEACHGVSITLGDDPVQADMQVLQVGHRLRQFGQQA